jgi:copper(I)-binding protein
MNVYRIFLAFVLLTVWAPTGAIAVPGSVDIKIEDAEAHFSAMKPDMGTIFMKIRNAGKTEDVLLSASVDLQGVTAELHDVKHNSMMKVDYILVPEKSDVILKRGAMHIMLFNLPVTAKEGQEFTVLLKFEKAGEKRVKAKFSGMGHEMHGH